MEIHSNRYFSRRQYGGDFCLFLWTAFRKYLIEKKAGSPSSSFFYFRKENEWEYVSISQVETLRKLENIFIGARNKSLSFKEQKNLDILYKNIIILIQ